MHATTSLLRRYATRHSLLVAVACASLMHAPAQAQVAMPLVVAERLEVRQQLVRGPRVVARQFAEVVRELHGAITF